MTSAAEEISSRAVEPCGGVDYNRRAEKRYPIHILIQYWAVDRCVVAPGRGRTVNISSGGILFRFDGPPPAAPEIEIALEWPIPSEDGFGLRLRTRARLVRVEDGYAAVAFSRYEFRTRRLHPARHAA